ncbi:hypothetical protein [Pseudomonas sp.]|uniref:hypothetical protein n=1 Tax=Pseudomonas sp. TaxID=306 RepID=UPI00258C3867|nr:hypothetical protein [Pseudomonas sp.]
MNLFSHQRAQFDALIGFDGTGARRAWVSLPLGSGSTTVAVTAAVRLYRYSAVQRILYVTENCMRGNVHRIAGEYPVHKLDPKADVKAGITCCSSDMLRRHHDTTILYTGFDLVVVDVGFDPMRMRGKVWGAAMQTLLQHANRLWLVGGNV